MKKIRLLLCSAIGVFLLGCSNDDEGSKCESCTSDAGTKFEVCDNGDGTCLTKAGDEVDLISEQELQEILDYEELTLRELVQMACIEDGEY
ncbi:hypothetical protein [Flagellimonas eckloniae]|uniref:Lipoprotein n=1 Tax=Flagellimonas eckloniae TaxID=346185 RepID=A0A0Q0XIA7_9FLAO|nr:hypothetical protein [Allomuricauda eckloniae]KQC30698.1 hypothetical protein AAY42_13015 [Allomuricauda eckloniae]